MTAPAVVDLGLGFVAHQVWLEGVDRSRALPVGLLIRHGCARGVYVAWADDGSLYSGDRRPRWTLVSMVPLTIEPGVTCPQCGVTGEVREGRWVPENEEATSRW